MSSDKKHILALFIGYTLSFGLMLLNDGIFWDDLVLVGSSQSEIIDTFKQAGTPFAWTGHLHYFLLSLPGSVHIYRLICFISYFLSGFLFFKTIKKLGFNTNESYFTTLFMLLLPYNCARIALINVLSSLCYLSFFCGFYLFIQSKKSSTFLSFFFFIFAFNVQSILVFFYASIIPYLFFVEGKRLQAFLHSIKRNLLILISPIIYFLLKNIFWAPYDLYSNYNAFQFKNVRLLTKDFPRIFSIALFNIKSDAPFYIAIALLLTLLYFHIRRGRKFTREVFLLCISYWLIWASMFPYLAVGLEPAFEDWSSRHQILLSVGVSFSILALLCLLMRIEFKYSPSSLLVFNLLILISLVLPNSLQYYSYQKDYFFQKQLIQEIKNNSIFKSHDTFIFKNDKGIWASKRALRFYEFSAFFKNIFGDESRFGSIFNERKYAQQLQFRNEKYDLSDYKGRSGPLYFQIKKIQDPGFFETFALDAQSKKYLEIILDTQPKQ